MSAYAVWVEAQLPVPPQSHFTKLTVELVARPIESGGGPAGMADMIA